MKQFAVILTINYRNAMRTRKGKMSGKNLQQVSRRVTENAVYQAEAGSAEFGAPVIINLRFRELKPKAKQLH